MPDGDELKSHALNSSHDFYELLEIPEGAQENEIRRAYRKTALKYHPDKVGANPEALEKFHLLQIAYDVLSEPGVRELYDNARRARQAKVERDRQFEGRRKAMKEDLERRENGAAKRKRDEVDAEEQFARELRRLAEDGKRRRKEREEVLRREAEEIEQEERKAEEGLGPKEASHGEPNGNGKQMEDIDRSITLRFAPTAATSHINGNELRQRFQRFGAIDDVLLREKKIKVDGEKHRRPYMTAVIVYQSVVGAHAAVSDFPQLSQSEPEAYGMFENVEWAGGKEPAFVPRPASRVSQPDIAARSTASAPVNGTDAASKKAPSFTSFRGTANSSNGPSLDEMTMMRLKNAERRRMEEKIRKEDAAAAAVTESTSTHDVPTE